MRPENGSPRSRAKEKTTRELCAMRNARLTRAMIATRIVRPRAPLAEPVAFSKIAMRGTPVEVLATSSILPMQNIAAIRKTKPVKAPIQTDQIMALGAVLRASWSSSIERGQLSDLSELGGFYLSYAQSLRNGQCNVLGDMEPLTIVSSHAERSLEYT